MSFRSKVENIWYHYKAHITVGIFLLFVLIVALHSCVTKSEYDIQVYYLAGSSSLYQEQLDWIRDSVAAQCGDVNGDGQVNVAVTGLRVGTFSDASIRAQYMNTVQAGEVMLLLGDSGGIDYLISNNYLQPLTAFSDRTEKGGYAWKVNGSGFATRVSGFEMFSDVELYVGLRVFDNTWSAATESCKENYEIACSVLRNMVSALPEYDLRVCYLTAESTADLHKIQWIEKAVSSVCSDLNGDNKISVKVTPLDLSNQPTLEKNLASLAGDARLFFADEAALKILKDRSLLSSLSSLYGEPVSDGFARDLASLPVSSAVEGFSAFGEKKLYLALYATLKESAETAVYAQNASLIASELCRIGVHFDE